jgi:hypothetical protein
MPLMYVVNKLIKVFSSPKNVALNKSLGQLATLTFSMALIIAGTSSQKMQHELDVIKLNKN